MEEKLIRFLDDNQIEYEMHVSMSEKTWIHRGPIVPFFVIPGTIDLFKRVIVFLQKNHANYKVIGHTSNLYFKSSYETTVIVSTRKLTSYFNEGVYLWCDTGVSVSKLSRRAVEMGYEGFEGLVGLPGTVGAAIVNNSSCFQCSVSALVEKVEVLEIKRDGTVVVKTVGADLLAFRHRSSAIKRGELYAVVLRAQLRIRKTDNIEKLKQKALCNIETRIKTQEGKVQNLGSVFSSYYSKPIRLFSLGFSKVVDVLLFRIREYLHRNDESYQLIRNHYLFKLFDFSDIEKYVSEKNINCFIWKDDGADVAFDRYVEFMHLYATCGALEIEILQ